MIAILLVILTKQKMYFASTLVEMHTNFRMEAQHIIEVETKEKNGSTLVEMHTNFRMEAQHNIQFGTKEKNGSTLQ